MDYTIKSKLWIEANGNIILGEGRTKLLKAIDKEGSLSAAAKSLGMSYKKAWRLVDVVNKNAKQPVVLTSTGGSGGGGAEVTGYGKELIKQFEILKADCWKHLRTSEEKLKNL